MERDAVRLTARVADLARPARDSEGFEWAFDFVEHHVDLSTTRGQHRTIPLVPMTVANFYAMVLDAMDAVGMPVTINPMPNEIADAIPFQDDTVHAVLPT